ncbi:MAG: hypothetical protein LC795_01460 [Acidobacteria bacterium]|nr:hypothetical protein [Acidobacteriota bacterium]
MALSTRALFGKRALYQLPASDYVDWAVEMLAQGSDSYSLRILAGLGPSTSSFEAEGYFLRSARELGLRIPDSAGAVRAYACEIARELVEGRLDAREAVRALYRICLGTEYEREYIIWLRLDDALDSLLSGGYAYTYESATLENFEEVARQEAGKFVAEMCGGDAT